jgi:hypothetical protein
MKIAAEALELGRKQHGIGMVDLLRGKPAPSGGAANMTVRGLDLVELVPANAIPFVE